MNQFRSLIAGSMLFVAPVLALAQGNAGQMPHGGMMDAEQMEQMHQNMSEMQNMMNEMPAAGSTAERQKIRQQHMESMQEHMKMMRGGMMGQGMKGHGRMGDHQGMMNNGHGMMGNQQGKKDKGNKGKHQSGGPAMDNDQRLQMMENRMDQMQLMMEQMLQHQSMMGPKQ